jgi:hypothetical protein
VCAAAVRVHVYAPVRAAPVWRGHALTLWGASVGLGCRPCLPVADRERRRAAQDCSAGGRAGGGWYPSRRSGQRRHRGKGTLPHSTPRSRASDPPPPPPPHRLGGWRRQTRLSCASPVAWCWTRTTAASTPTPQCPTLSRATPLRTTTWWVVGWWAGHGMLCAQLRFRMGPRSAPSGRLLARPPVRATTYTSAHAQARTFTGGTWTVVRCLGADEHAHGCSNTLPSTSAVTSTSTGTSTPHPSLNCRAVLCVPPCLCTCACTCVSTLTGPGGVPAV